MRYPKKATYSFHLHKEGKEVNLEDLSEEERRKVGEWAYRTILESMGYVRVEKKQTRNKE